MPACENGAPQPHGAVVDEELGRDAVGGVDDEVGGAEQRGAVVGPQRLGVRLDRAACGKARRRRAAADSTLGVPIAAVRVQDLAVQIGELDHVGVDQRQRVPTPAAARCHAAGQPSAPTPTTSTRAAARRRRAVAFSDVFTSENAGDAEVSLGRNYRD